jgi:hypothetical protein
MNKISVRTVQDPLNVEHLQVLFQARKSITDSLVAISNSWSGYSSMESTYNEQMDKLDSLIRDLAGVVKADDKV